MCNTVTEHSVAQKIGMSNHTLFEKNKTDDNYEQLCEIVITVYDGSSFDKLFRDYDAPGRRVYSLDTESVIQLIPYFDRLGLDELDKILSSPYTEEWIREIIEKIQLIGVRYTTINIECCSSFSSKAFSAVDRNIDMMALTAVCMEKGMKMIFADFALKALIGAWDEELLGMKCPFVNIGNTRGNICVKFPIEACKNCVFVQLSAVAQLAFPEMKTDESEVSISKIVMSAISNTIVYTLSQDADHRYVRVMSVATNSIIEKKVGDNLINNSSIKPNKLTRQSSFYPDRKIQLDKKGEITHSMTSQSFLPTLSDCSFVIPVVSNDYCYDDSDNLSECKIEQNSTGSDIIKDCRHCVHPSLPLNNIHNKGENTDHGYISMDLDDDKYEVSKVLAHSTKSLYGLPVHTIVTFPGKPGVLIVSSLHITNLVKVDTDVSSVIDVANKKLSRAISDQLSADINDAILQGPDALERSINRAVTTIAACSSAPACLNN